MERQLTKMMFMDLNQSIESINEVMFMDLNQRSESTDENGDLERDLWSGLPMDILSMIMGRLCPFDVISFRSVCKSWRLACNVESFSRLPVFMNHNWEWARNGNILSIHRFQVAFWNDTRVSRHEMKWDEWEDIFGASICASSFNWVLLQRSAKSFLYCPFSKTILRLPDVDITFNRASFSSVPTKSDCVVFVIESSKSSEMIRILTCRPGDQRWRSQTFDGIFKAIEDVIYSNGIFYCVFSGGVLGAYDVALLEWTVLTNMNPIPDTKIQFRAQIFVSDGELLLVFHSSRFHTYMFDWSARTWVKIRTLGNKVLFLGRTSSAIIEVEETFPRANSVYYLGDKQVLKFPFMSA